MLFSNIGSSTEKGTIPIHELRPDCGRSVGISVESHLEVSTLLVQ